MMYYLVESQIMTNISTLAYQQTELKYNTTFCFNCIPQRKTMSTLTEIRIDQYRDVKCMIPDSPLFLLWFLNKG